MDALFKLAEERIQQAIENGELDNLPGQGKPLADDDCRQVPPELRMAYRVLKNNGLMPQEMELRREILHLEKLLAKCRQDTESGLQAQALQKKLLEKHLQFNIMMDKRRMRR
ncbi:DUF1992 domain-containing protein [Acetonema longum]|uniref:DnaJ homologue subfamily C member 28 conserved domain-containing protein n=1 Tax=Acetonema longum DSM 6540 TaxID=1009370 RepID=F7NP84_9FIRM|nr:DUF1992 domain-containing protein [Acetonema longum]EGO62207.1 hypothetical protein ALO_19637 [Acetonema longum DSM 6540]